VTSLLIQYCSIPIMWSPSPMFATHRSSPQPDLVVVIAFSVSFGRLARFGSAYLGIFWISLFRDCRAQTWMPKCII